MIEVTKTIVKVLNSTLPRCRASMRTQGLSIVGPGTKVRCQSFKGHKSNHMAVIGAKFVEGKTIDIVWEWE